MNKNMTRNYLIQRKNKSLTNIAVVRIDFDEKSKVIAGESTGCIIKDGEFVRVRRGYIKMEINEGLAKIFKENYEAGKGIKYFEGDTWN